MAPTPTPPSTESLPAPFRDARLLGRGAFGLVWAATGPDGRAVAVKVLGAEHAADPEALWRFGAEYARLAELDHPAFPRALGEGRTADGRPYVWMSLVEGAEAKGPLGALEVRRLVGELADALGYLHGLGWVHGDLKPANVLVEADGRARLVDVGLLARTGDRRGAIAGTLEYLAPEAWRLAMVDPAMDMYALGATAYALWTGQPPFTGGPGALAQAHLALAAPPLAGRTPDADAALEALILALLAKDPEGRPTAHETRVALGLAAPAARTPRLRAGALVGRDGAIMAFREALAAPGARLAYVGGAGMGKTRLLDALRPEAIAAGQVWVGARAIGPADAPGAPMRAVVAQATAAAGMAPGEAVAAWIAGAMHPAWADLDPAARRVAAHQAAAGALAQAARALGGLVVALDDWHLADPTALEAIRVLSAVDAPITWVIASAVDVPGATAVPLSPLDDAEVAALVGSRIGAAPPDGLVAPIALAAEGVPAAVERLIGHAVATGALGADAAGWTFAPGRWRGGTLASALAERVAGLDADARALLDALAVAAPAGALPLTMMASAAGIAPGAAARAAAEVAGLGLLESAEGRARLETATAGALAAELDADRRAALADALAGALLGEVAPEAAPTDTLVAAAALAEAGSDDARAARLASEAGRRALALGATAEARRWLAAATARMPESAEPAEQLAAWMALGEAERFLGAAEPAEAAYRRAVPLAEATDDQEAAVDAALGLAKCAQLQGRYDEALTHLGAARAGTRALDDPAREARVALAAARVRLYVGDTAGARAAAAEAAERAGTVAAALRAQALNLQGVLEVQRDPARPEAGLAMLDEALALSRGLGDGRGEGTALDNLGNALLTLGDLSGAERAFREAARVSRAIGTEVDALSPELNLAIALADRGCPAEAGPLAQAVAARAQAAGRRFPHAAALAVAAQAAIAAGRPAEAAPWLDEALAEAQAIANRYLEEFVRLIRLEAWLALGDVPAAAAEAAVVAPLNEALGHADVAARLAAALGELARLEGDPTRARAQAEAALESPARVSARAAHRLLARLDLADGAPAAALSHAEAALAIANAWPSDHHAASDWLLVAEALAAAGDRDGELGARRRALSAGGPESLAGAIAAWALGDQAAMAEAGRFWRPALEALGEGAQAFATAAGLPAFGAATAGPGSALDLGRLAWAIGELGALDDETAIARFALETACDLVGADRGYVLLYDELGRLASTIGRAMDAEAAVAEGFSRTLAERTLYSGEPLYVVDAMAEDTWREAESVQALALRTVAALPLATPRVMLGVLYMDREALEPVLADADVALLAAFAGAAADAIVRGRAEAHALAERDALAAQLALSGALATFEDAQSGRLAVLEALAGAVGADRGLWLDEGPKAAWGAAGEAPSRHVTDWVAERGEPLGLWDVGAAEGWKEHESIQAMGLRTIWCLPAPDGGLVYLDVARLAPRDPAFDLPALTGLLAAAAPHVARWARGGG